MQTLVRMEPSRVGCYSRRNWWRRKQPPRRRSGLRVLLQPKRWNVPRSVSMSFLAKRSQEMAAIGAVIIAGNGIGMLAGPARAGDAEGRTVAVALQGGKRSATVPLPAGWKSASRNGSSRRLSGGLTKSAGPKLFATPNSWPNSTGDRFSCSRMMGRWRLDAAEVGPSA